eukprot:3891879-Lingulodinium_polyedra.AAC.1
MRFYESSIALAADMGISVSTLEETHEEHYQAASRLTCADYLAAMDGCCPRPGCSCASVIAASGDL